MIRKALQCADRKACNARGYDDTRYTTIHDDTRRYRPIHDRYMVFVVARYRGPFLRVSLGLFDTHRYMTLLEYIKILQNTTKYSKIHLGEYIPHIWGKSRPSPFECGDDAVKLSRMVIVAEMSDFKAG